MGNLTFQMIEYKMSSKPRGLCLIINNVNFDPPYKNRYGSNSDEGYSFFFLSKTKFCPF